MSANTVFWQKPKTGTFGPAFDAELDTDRLLRQMDVIADFMADCVIEDRWVTLEEIERATGYPQASISAQLRHLRKPKFGGHTVEKRRRGKGGTFEYMVMFRG